MHSLSKIVEMNRTPTVPSRIRKPVQFFLATIGEAGNVWSGRLWVLCDDGTLWRRDDEKGPWTQYNLGDLCFKEVQHESKP